MADTTDCPFNLNIILDSPAVICDKGDCYHLMIPDLLDEHRPPGISGMGADGTDFARGMYEIAITFQDKKKKGGDGTMYAGGSEDDANTLEPKIDIVPATIPSAHASSPSAPLLLKVSFPAPSIAALHWAVHRCAARVRPPSDVPFELYWILRATAAVLQAPCTRSCRDA